MITHVEVTPSSGSDSVVTTRVIDELSERGIGPSEPWVDTSNGSGRNGWEAERRGTELVSPVGGWAHKEPGGGGDEPVRLTTSDSYIDAMATGSAVCPAGHGGGGRETRKRMRLSGWRYTSPGRCVGHARCVPGVL